MAFHNICAEITSGLWVLLSLVSCHFSLTFQNDSYSHLASVAVAIL